jgi:cob(I)alamin adenosyltransferase
MPIYTKTGDLGFTTLYDGSKLLKNDNIISILGDIDELNAHIGLSLCNLDRGELLPKIQSILFELSSYIANYNLNFKCDEYVTMLETEIDKIMSSLPKLVNFIMPKGNYLICNLHITRTVCRRVERNCINLENKISVRFLNRLSDYLFALAYKYSCRNNFNYFFKSIFINIPYYPFKSLLSIWSKLNIKND